MNHTDDRRRQGQLQRLSPQQRARLANRLAAQKRQTMAREAQSMPAVQPDPARRFEPFALNDIQQAYLIGRAEGIELGNIACHTYNEVDITDWNQSLFEHALRQLIERHEMLRAIVFADGRQQILAEVPPYQVHVEDLRELNDVAREARLEEIRSDMSHAIMQTDRWPLFEFRASRIDARRTRMHVGVDLLIADGRSFEILIDELLQLYRNPDKVLAPLDLSFRDYVAALDEMEHSRQFQSSREYWTKKIPTLPPSPELPLANNPASVAHPAYSRRSARIDATVWRSLKQTAAGRGITPPGLLLAAYAEVLALWSKHARFTLNLTLFNRLPLHPEANQIIGDFTSLDLLEVDNTTDEAFSRRALRQKETLWQDLDHRYFSGIRVTRELARFAGLGPRALMPVVFTSLMNLDENSAGTAWPYRLGEPAFAITQTPQVYLDFMVQEDHGTLVLNWDAVDELFPAGMLDAMFEALQTLLDDLCKDETAWDRGLAENAKALLPRAQLDVRRSVNATDAPISDHLLHTGFIEQVSRQPDHMAVVTPTKGLTYGELHARASRVEQQLLELDVAPNQLVAVLMEKGWEQVVAVLGIHFAGGAYLPLDPELPTERLRYLLDHGNVRVILTTSSQLENRGIPDNADCLAIDRLSPLEGRDATARHRQAPEDLAYVIYTSGSTGLPKGVMIDHRGAVNTIADINRRFHVGPDDRVFALSRLNFDLSVYDIFGMLAAGGTIVMPASSAMLDSTHWADMVSRERVTIWNTVPALMQLLVDQSVRIANKDHLRLVMMSGDWIPVNLPTQIRREFPHASITSLGGATEASIWSILYPVETVEPGWTSIPYGKPMDNQHFHVLSDQLTPCPDWVPGQLHIGGIGLAKGYWRDAEKTGASFITHPVTGERLYRTGDLGRYMPDGNIEFLGREDFQVKVHGHRIELGEIEVHLLDCEGVDNCAVIVREDKPGEKRLVAYATAKPGNQLNSNELREYLRERIPAYMVPSTIMSLDRLPLSGNGKVDRKALPEPLDNADDNDVTPAAPRDPVELGLTRLWEDLLETRPVGIHDNFFDLGGSSLLAVRLFAQIEARFDKKIPLSVLFKSPTVASLAAVLRDAANATSWTSLVPVRVSGVRPPFFFVHGHWGNALLYRDLAKRLDEDQPFYAFQARGLTGEEAHHTIEEMARDYVEEMRSVQAKGPYYIGGYCFGGRVALEMAQQLRAAGEDVAMLVVMALFETGKAADASGLQRWFNAFTTGEPFNDRLKFHVARLRRLSPRKQLIYLTNRARFAAFNLGTRVKRAMWLSAYRYFMHRHGRLPRRLQNVSELDLTAALVYQTRYYPGCITFLLQGEVPADFSPDPQAGWLGYRADDFEVHIVVPKQEDMIMMREPYVADLARILADCAARAGSVSPLPPISTDANRTDGVEYKAWQTSPLSS